MHREPPRSEDGAAEVAMEAIAKRGRDVEGPTARLVSRSETRAIVECSRDFDQVFEIG